jgi:hypothetical protein
LAKLTAPGPPTFSQETLRPVTRPASQAEPARLAAFGIVAVWSGPASTAGGWLSAAGSLYPFVPTVRL